MNQENRKRYFEAWCTLVEFQKLGLMSDSSDDEIEEEINSVAKDLGLPKSLWSRLSQDFFDRFGDDIMFDRERDW